LAGKPVVGVAMMFEQEANIDCLVRKGFAVRIRKNRLTPEKLCEAIERLLADKEAQERARAFQKVVQKWDDPSIVARFFEETF
jgi:UDP:flavonoid glycosyltransferase YjiC (YdhE family)